MGTCRHRSFAGSVGPHRSMFTPQHGQMRSEPLAQFKRKRSPTFDSYHVIRRLKGESLAAVADDVERLAPLAYTV